MTNPARTIDRTEFNERGGVSRLLRGTDDGSPGNLKPIADFLYDANGMMSRRTVYPTGDPSSTTFPPRVTDLLRNDRGEIMAVVNPAAPHALLGRDNLGRVTSAGLFDGTRSEVLAAVPLPAPSDDSGLNTKNLDDNRLTLGTMDLNPLGQVYRQQMHPIVPQGLTGAGDRMTPSGPGDACDQPIERGFWYGAHGKTKLITGPVNQKMEHCRACEEHKRATLASVPASPSFSYAMAIQTDDPIVHEWRLEKTHAPGDALVEVSFDRRPGVDGASAVAAQGMPGLGMAWYPDGDVRVDLSDRPDGRMDLRIIKPGEFDGPNLHERWGNLGLDEGATPPLCCGADCSLVPGTVPAPLITEMLPDPREGYLGIYIPRPGEFDGPPASLVEGMNEVDWRLLKPGIIKAPEGGVTRLDLDDLGRPGNLMEWKGPIDPPSLPEGLCSQWVFTYNRGRPEDWGTPTTIGTSPSRRGYPDTVPGSSTPPPNLGQFVRDNSVQVYSKRPDGAMAHWRTTATGEVEAAVTPSGHRVDVEYDPLGRPITATWTPPSSTPMVGPSQARFEYDALGRLVTAGSYLLSTDSSPAAQVRISHGPYGNPFELRQNPAGFAAVPGSGPLGTTDVGMATESCGPATSGERVGWNGPRQGGETLPGNYPLGMAYFPPSDPGDTPPGPGPAPLGEWDLDGLLNRVNHLSGPGLGGGGDETLTRYGYHGIARPAWRDMPVPQAQNPMFMPSVVPASSPGIASPVLPPLDNWGRVQRDIWQRPTGDTHSPVRPYDPSGSMAGGSTYTGEFGPGWLHHERFARDKDGRTTDTFDDALTWRTDPNGGTASAMAGWDRTLGRDPCTGELTYCGTGINPGSVSGGMLLSDGPGRVQRAQGWKHDARGNWLDFADHRARTQSQHPPIAFTSGVPGGTLDGSVSGGASPGDSHVAAAFSVADMPTTRKHATADHALSTVPTAVITHDANGNCTDNGRWVFRYTPAGQLAEVYRRGGTDGEDRGEGTTGALFARFEYNALGWRVSACYDVDSPDGDLDNETRELYLYDVRWRLVGVMSQGAEGTGGAASGVRPSPRLRERYVYHRQGLRGGANVTGLDQIVCRHRDADDNVETSLPGREDGLEEVTYYMQNHRSDVVGVLDASGVLLERVRYSAYGEPQAILPVDLNADGTVDSDELSDFIAAYFAFDAEAMQASPPWLDFDTSTQIDADDLADYIAAYFAVDPGDIPPLSDAARLGPPPSSDPAGLPPGVGSLSRPSVANRFGFAGYVWDDHLGLYHVRHRAYDPYHGRWLQPDPIGIAGGFNLYQYCGGEPVDFIDPLGLGPRDEFATMGQGMRAAREIMDDRGMTGPMFPSVDTDDSIRQMHEQGEHGLGLWAGAMAGLVEAELALLASPFMLLGDIVERGVEDGLGSAGMRVLEVPRDIKEGLVGIVHDFDEAISGKDAYGSDLTPGQQVKRGVRGLVNALTTVAGLASGGRGKRGSAAGGADEGCGGTAAPTISRPTREIEFEGRRVWQRDDLIDPDRVGADGRTNLQRMSDGDAPIGPDGKSVHLHHVAQRETTPIMEVSRDRHNSTPHPDRHSDVDHGSAWRTWRESYWQERARNWGR